jgi:hypothetical protein
MLHLTLAAALLPLFTTLSPTPQGDPDCAPNGQSTTTSIYGPVEEECATSSYPYTCSDGSIINKETETCSLTRKVTRTTVKKQSSPSGLPCPDIVTIDTYTELVGFEVYEYGELCPVAPNVCCVVYAHGWEYENGGTKIKSRMESREIVCPDGSQGIETTATQTLYQKRRVRSWTWSQPSGDCDEGETCEDTETFGSWELVPLYTRKWVFTSCPIGTGGFAESAVLGDLIPESFGSLCRDVQPEMFR